MKEKESFDIIYSDTDNNNYQNKFVQNNLLNNNDNTDNHYYYGKRFSTPKNLKLNLLLLNNKSINYTNKNSFLHKSMQKLTEKKPKIMERMKNDRIKTNIGNMTNNTNDSNNIKWKENYAFKRNSYYKKNLIRIKLFYGYDKK